MVARATWKPFGSESTTYGGGGRLSLHLRFPPVAPPRLSGAPSPDHVAGRRGSCAPAASPGRPPELLGHLGRLDGRTARTNLASSVPALSSRSEPSQWTVCVGRSTELVHHLPRRRRWRGRVGARRAHIAPGDPRARLRPTAGTGCAPKRSDRPVDRKCRLLEWTPPDAGVLATLPRIVERQSGTRVDPTPATTTAPATDGRARPAGRRRRRRSAGRRRRRGSIQCVGPRTVVRRDNPHVDSNRASGYRRDAGLVAVEARGK